MNINIFLFGAAILIVAGLLLLVINLTKPHVPQLDKEKYQRNWLKIENSLIKDNDSLSNKTVILTLSGLAFFVLLIGFLLS